MLSIPNQSLVILENEYHRIGRESVVGVQDSFHRYVDSDMVYFQFCGESTVETEFGVYDMEPGEVMLVPAASLTAPSDATTACAISAKATRRWTTS